ncbi:MAG: hypothetical protein RLZZ90_1153, partial [Actinomycetota bacterium]
MNIRSRTAASAIAIAIIATSAIPAQAAGAPVYIETIAKGISLKVLASAGDVISGYQIQGIPDGTGAYKSGNSVKILMNHEISYGTLSSTQARAG